MVGDASNAVEAADGAADPVERAIAAFREGGPVCVHDFDDREGEVDLIYPARAVDPDAVARLRNEAGGLLCVAFSADVADAAALPYLADVVDHPAAGGEAMAYGDRPSFSLTVNHRDTFTGVTDDDRALTISELGRFARRVREGADQDAPGADAFAERFRSPGHVHLLRAADGLLEERRGHTELGIALAEAADREPAVVVCEMLDDETGGALSAATAREYAGHEGFPFVEGRRLVERLG